MTPETERLIARLQRSARNVAAAVNPAQREAAQTYLIKRADELRVERDRIEQKLGRQLDWLNASDDPKVAAEERARFDRREDQFIALLTDYERIEDTLGAVLVMWLHGEGAA